MYTHIYIYIFGNKVLLCSLHYNEAHYVCVTTLAPRYSDPRQMSSHLAKTIFLSTYTKRSKIFQMLFCNVLEG